MTMTPRSRALNELTDDLTRYDREDDRETVIAQAHRVRRAVGSGEGSECVSVIDLASFGIGFFGHGNCPGLRRHQRSSVLLLADKTVGPFCFPRSHPSHDRSRTGARSGQGRGRCGWLVMAGSE